MMKKSILRVFACGAILWAFSASFADERPDVPDDTYADGGAATHAIDRLRELKKETETPFFMAEGFARPHLPFSSPKMYWNMYDVETLPMPEYEQVAESTAFFAIKGSGEIFNFKPFPEVGPKPEEMKRYVIHGYYELVSYVDALVGCVVNELNFEQANRIPYVFEHRNHVLAIHQLRYRLVRWVGVSRRVEPICELYDYEKDPLETVNLDKSQPEVLAMMKRIADPHLFFSQVAKKGKEVV